MRSRSRSRSKSPRRGRRGGGGRTPSPIRRRLGVVATTRRSRTRSPPRRQRRSDPSPSPSPPRKSSSDRLIRKAKAILDGIELSFKGGDSGGGGGGGGGGGAVPIYRGPELPPISLKEQRKIQIDIRRNIPSIRISTSPIRREILNPLHIIIPRQLNEGCRPIFDREEIRKFDGRVQEPKVIALTPPPIEKYERKLKESLRSSRSRSPPDLRGRLSEGDRHRRDGYDSRRLEVRSGVHDRLGGHMSTTSKGWGRNGSGGGGVSGAVMDRVNNKEESVRSRLGRKPEFDTNRVLRRDELESQRPEVKPWDINPEFVPRGRNYYEHDNREEFDPDETTNSFRGDRFRGGRRGGGFRRGRFQRNSYGRNRQDPLSTMEWKHDKFEEELQEPTSTTAN